VNQGFLKATTTPTNADAFLIAVPTPFQEGHQPDLRFIDAAARSIAPVLAPGNLVILESTSPVGTTERLDAILSELRPDLTFPVGAGEASDIRIAHCPERVLPGHVLRELVQNDRIVGGITPRCSEAAIELYQTFVEGNCMATDARTAEMCKLTENSFRDLNIAFANELSVICDGLDIDTWELIRLANHHPRVNILNPGPGVGGHCIAVDPWFIVSQSPDAARLIRTARETNDAKPEYVARKILSAAENSGASAVICLGASFKADIDDTRESPAVEVIRHLSQSGIQVDVVEPNIDRLPGEISDCRLVSLGDALIGAEEKLFAILVAHREFRESDELKRLNALDFCGALHQQDH
jgi:UDP-N-acetyl-D-mannosaminuronic acid dehydrogenase